MAGVEEAAAPRAGSADGDGCEWPHKLESRRQALFQAHETPPVPVPRAIDAARGATLGL